MPAAMVAVQVAGAAGPPYDVRHDAPGQHRAPTSPSVALARPSVCRRAGLLLRRGLSSFTFHSLCLGPKNIKETHVNESSKPPPVHSGSAGLLMSEWRILCETRALLTAGSTLILHRKRNSWLRPYVSPQPR